MDIRKIGKEDLAKAVDLVWKVFQEFEAPNYSNQGIEEFKKFISFNTLAEKLDNEEMYILGCYDDKKLAGVIATRNISHICMLFVYREYHKRGIAKSLFQSVLEDVKKYNNTSQITVNSSIYAKDVYHRLGFIDLAEEQMVNGIRFIPMSYPLDKNDKL